MVAGLLNYNYRFCHKYYLVQVGLSLSLSLALGKLFQGKPLLSCLYVLEYSLHETSNILPKYWTGLNSYHTLTRIYLPYSNKKLIWLYLSASQQLMEIR